MLYPRNFPLGIEFAVVGTPGSTVCYREHLHLYGQSCFIDGPAAL